MDRRRELGEFLRSRRERRRPEDAGLAVGGRRRTPGLRREEVATLAGMSVTWYTWLEQGRAVQASPQVLDSLVDVLDLDPVERAHLFRLAGEVPPRTDGSERTQDADQYQPMLDQFDPNPALLVNRRFDVVAWNRGATVLYGDLARIDPERRNVLWLVFTSEQVRATADDWEAEAARTVAFFRAQVGAAVDEPAVARLVAELEAASPDFARIWSRRELAARPTDRRTVHHPALGRVEFRLTKMRTLDDEHTLVAFLAPPGSGAADRLAALVAPDHG